MSGNFFAEAIGMNMLEIMSSVISFMMSSGVAIALYVLRCAGFYAIAKRRQIKRPWLAWIPVVGEYILGSISDQYRYVVKGENKKKRITLLWVSIVGNVAMVVLELFFAWAVIFAVLSSVSGMMVEMVINQLMDSLLIIVIVFLVSSCIALLYKVIRLIALYDLYRSCDPENAVLYLVVGILFGFTEPFFIFFNRGRDKGMPPRKVNPAYVPAQPQYQPPQPQYQPHQTGENIWNQSGE